MIRAPACNRRSGNLKVSATVLEQIVARQIQKSNDLL